MGVGDRTDLDRDRRAFHRSLHRFRATLRFIIDAIQDHRIIIEGWQHSGIIEDVHHQGYCEMRVLRGGERRGVLDETAGGLRSEEHTSELQSLMRISYAVFCLKNKKQNNSTKNTHAEYAMTSENTSTIIHEHIN